MLLKKETLAREIKSDFSHEEEAKIKLAVGGKCEKCGRKEGAFLKISHIMPLIRYGGITVSNFVVLCPTCHYENPSSTEMKKAISRRGNEVKEELKSIIEKS